MIAFYFKQSGHVLGANLFRNLIILEYDINKSISIDYDLALEDGYF